MELRFALEVAQSSCSVDRISHPISDQTDRTTNPQVVFGDFEKPISWWQNLAFLLFLWGWEKPTKGSLQPSAMKKSGRWGGACYLQPASNYWKDMSRFAPKSNVEATDLGVFCQTWPILDDSCSFLSGLPKSRKQIGIPHCRLGDCAAVCLKALLVCPSMESSRRS